MACGNFQWDRDCLGSLTAREALCWGLACDCEGAGSIREHLDDARGLECYLLALNFALLRPYATLTEDLASQLASVVRRRFVKKIDVLQIPHLACEVGEVLKKKCRVADGIAPEILKNASLQITTAVLSLMKRYEKLERLLFALEELSDVWDAPLLERAALCYTALLPCGCEALAQWRLDCAGMSELWRFVGPDAWHFRMSILCFCHEIPVAEKFLNPFLAGLRDGLKTMLDAHAMQGVVACAVFAPRGWLWQQYEKLDDASRGAFEGIWRKLEAFGIGGGQFNASEGAADALYRLALDERACDVWLWQTKGMHAADTLLQTLLQAIARQESGDEQWFVKLIGVATPESIEAFPKIWPCSPSSFDARDFFAFWCALALRDAQMGGQARDLLENYLSRATVHCPLLDWLHADIVSKNSILAQMPALPEGNFVVSAPFLEAAGVGDGQTGARFCMRMWHRLEAQARANVGKAALDYAVKCSHVDEGALEIALEFSAGKTLCHAALMAWDAGISDGMEKVAVALSGDRVACVAFVGEIARRGLQSGNEKLTALAVRLEDLMGMDPLCDILKFLSYPEPLEVVEILACAMAKLGRGGALFWTCASLWVGVNLDAGRIVEAVDGIVDALDGEDVRGLKVLMELMASIPREAVGFLQTLMRERHGEKGAAKIWDRLRAVSGAYQSLAAQIVEKNRESEAQMPEVTPYEASFWMMPLHWQAIYRASRLMSRDLEEKAARRLEILQSRGYASKNVGNAPEKAQWVHARQPKASDAFGHEN